MVIHELCHGGGGGESLLMSSRKLCVCGGEGEFSRASLLIVIQETLLLISRSVSVFMVSAHTTSFLVFVFEIESYS